jgi:ribosomal protein L17
MRHRYYKLNKLNTGVQKKSIFLRNLLTSLITHGTITTTSKRAQVLEAYANAFFAKLIGMTQKYEKADAQREMGREVKRLVLEEKAGKKVVQDLIPQYQQTQKASQFVSLYKLGPRKGDGAEEILVKLS